MGTLGLAVWLGVLLTVPPQRLLTYIAFFAPLWLFLGSYGAAAIYWVTGRAEYSHRQVLANAVREGMLIAAVICVNLGLVAGRRWNVVWLFVTVVAGVAIEFLGRLRAPPDEVSRAIRP